MDQEEVAVDQVVFHQRLDEDAAAKAVTATPFTRGRVDGMAFSGGSISLRVNGTLVPMLDVIEVLAAPNAAASVPTPQEPTTP